jgi:hypothetical protein
MPRGLTQAEKEYAGPSVWAAEITTLEGALHRFAEDRVVQEFGAKVWLPNLLVTQGPHFTRSLQADFGEVTLLDADLSITELLEEESFEGALCELKEILLGLDREVAWLRARLTEQEVTDLGVKYRLVSDADYGQIALHERAYAQLCTWNFRRALCGYLEAEMSFTERLGTRTADIFSLTTIGDSTLAMTPEEHATGDRYVVITAGTGRGQKRLVQSNTATTFTIYRWATEPDGTSQFKVFEFAGGAPKLMPGGQMEALTDAIVFGENPPEIGVLLASSGMVTDEHAGDLLYATSGPRAGLPPVRITRNTSDTIFHEPATPGFSPPETVRVLFSKCPKDYAPSCEDRARVHAFNGYPTLVPVVQQAFHLSTPALGGGGGGGGGGGDGRDDTGARLALL